MHLVEYSYEGERSATGLRHGRGVCVFANGDRYEGTWTVCGICVPCVAYANACTQTHTNSTIKCDRIRRTGAMGVA
jgi:hypothetical protein